MIVGYSQGHVVLTGEGGRKFWITLYKNKNTFKQNIYSATVAWTKTRLVWSYQIILSQVFVYLVKKDFFKNLTKQR